MSELQHTLREVLEKPILPPVEKTHIETNHMSRAKRTALLWQSWQNSGTQARVPEVKPKQPASVPESPRISRFELNRQVVEYCNGRPTVSGRELWTALGISSTIVGRVLLRVGYVREGEKDRWMRKWSADKRFRTQPLKFRVVPPTQELAPVVHKTVPAIPETRTETELSQNCQNSLQLDALQVMCKPEGLPRKTA